MSLLIKSLTANILSKIDANNLPESFCQRVLERLDSFGYDLSHDDVWILCFSIKKVENYFNNSCNTDSIPEGLLCDAIDRICGEFLLEKSKTGQIKLQGLDLTGEIASISEGDVSISFANGLSDEDKFNTLLKHLLSKGEGEFVCYRKLKW